jgi:hypothetical protein
MKRPIRWYWAALWSLLAFYAVGLLMAALFAGSPLYGDEAPLEDVTKWAYWTASGQIGEGPAMVFTVLLLATLPMTAAVFTFAWLRSGRAPGDGYLHCLKCGYILKGLSEPRCPECGERI